MFLVICITLLSLSLAYLFWRQRGLPPGPWGIPIIGYLPWLDPKAPHLTFTALSKKYGSIYGLTLGNVYTVVLSDPKAIKQLFFKDSTTGRAPLYLTHGIMKGYGLICAEGELWKEQRRFVHNCLRQLGGSKIGNQRKNMEALIMENVRDFIEYINNQGDKVTLDPLEPLRHSLGSAINILVFGKSWPRDDETWNWLQHLQEEGTKHIGVAGPLNFLPFLRFVPKFHQTMSFLIDGKQETHRVYQRIIEEQGDLLKKQTAEDVDGNNNVRNVIQAFIVEKAKHNGNANIEKFYSNEQFYHLLADLFGAGLDTTLTTLRWYLLFLAKHPEVQASIRREIQDVIQNRPPTLEDMPHLPLVEASICETQRIRPVVPLGIPHGSLEELQVDGFRIPKGTMLVPLQWALHMNDAVWVDPEKFDPSRFLDDDGKVVRDEYFMPFQIGKRMCVGDELARMLLFLFGSCIVQNFHLGLVNEDVDLRGECGITLTPTCCDLVFTKID